MTHKGWRVVKPQLNQNQKPQFYYIKVGFKGVKIL